MPAANWSYSGSPGSSAKDAVRFLIGDTDECKPLLTDGEITYFLSQYNQAPINASIRCCEAIMAKFSRRADESVGQVRITFSQQSKMYRTMRDDLIRRLAKEDGAPYAGGISKTDVQTVALNADRVPPDFTAHMMENQQISPWVSNQYGSYFGWGGWNV